MRAKIIPITKSVIGPIEDGVPIPILSNKNKNVSKWPLSLLEPGQSFTVPLELRTAIRSSMSVFHLMKEHKGKRLISRTEGDRLRIWRIK